MISVSAPVETQAYMLRGVDIEQDAAKLAKMWNDSDDQWPGTVTNGVPMTAAAARKWFEQQKCIDALVWDTGDDIAGYCSFWAKPDEANVTYIAEINIAPAYQGQSLARKLLVHFVERAAAMDSPRLDLNTWSGNLKAVPLYKKCGFCWAPGTSVAMYNCMPAILSLPCAQAFFAQHNWYHAFKRTLTQAEDDERWEGMGVFTYHFEANGDQMTVWVDREARRITAVETATFFAAAIMTDQEPPHGLATVMRWKLTNKRDQPMHIALLASGSADLKLDHQTTLQLAPGESVEIKAEVRIAAQMAPIDAAKPAPTLRSLFVIDGAPLELHTGVRPRLAIEVGADPEYLTLMPGVPQTIHLQLRSNLSETASTTVRLTPTRGLSVDWTQQQVQLDARGFASLPATVQADLHGVLTLPVAASLERAGEHIHLPTISLSIFARPLGAVLAQHSGDKLRIENEHLRLIISQEGGKAEIYRVGTNEYLAEYAGYAAPPTRPNEFRNGRFELTLEQQDGQFIALATMASQEFPGFVLHKRFTVNAGPVIRVAYEFENRSAEQYTRQVYQWLQGDTETAMLTLPLAAGLGRGQWEVFPDLSDDEFEQAANYAERWAALEFPAAALGILWPADTERVTIAWGILQSRMYDCLPQSRVCPDAMHIYVGTGDWRTVQQLWRRLAGCGVKEDQQPAAPATPLSVRIEPALVIATDTTAQVALLVEHLRARRVDGGVYLELPPGWQANVTELAFNAVNWQHPDHSTVCFTTTAQPGAYTGRLALRSAELDADIELPLIRLGDGRSVAVRETVHGEQPILTIDNGRIEIDVTPGFAGTVSAIREGSVNHLRSPFPEVTTLGWMSPWYGGLMPILTLPDTFNFPDMLGKTIFCSELIDCEDSQGIVWQGVRQRATLSDPSLRGLTLEIDTLTVGGSPVVKLVLRLINATPVTRRLGKTGWILFVQPDGSFARTTVWGPDQQIKATERLIWLKTGAWSAAQNPESKRVIGVISPQGKAGMMGWGAEGNYLALLDEPKIPGNSTFELAICLALATDLDETRRYTALGRMFKS